jgi:predicted nucleic-acid-binding protein
VKGVDTNVLVRYIVQDDPIQFDVIEKDVVWGALHDFKTEKGDFADYYLGRRHRQADAEHTLTFDKALRNSSLFKFIEADPHR